MKKYLPLGIFAFTFLFFTFGQWSIDNFSFNSTAEASNKNYDKYEKIFLKGKFETISGSKIEISKIKSPLVMYNFWASWCGPCLEEMPSMINLRSKFKESELQIFAFNTDETNQLQNINKIIKKFNIKNELNIVADKNTLIADEFGFNAIPVTVIYKNGKVVFFSNGPVDFNAESFLSDVRKWLK